MGKLYVVGTPIGNLKDITFRAIEVLQSVNFIACEDTRRTSILLNHYKIEGKKLLSYYEPKESVQVPKIIKLLEKEDVALVTDAGMPSISDPGYKLIRACIEKGITVEVIPGPSAVITALVGSGLPTDRFTFVGFLPKKGLNSFLEELKAYKDSTIIAFESPNRVLKSLEAIKEVYGDNTTVCIARELTKLHEEYIRGRVVEVLEELNKRGEIKGEIVILWRMVED
ncbi:MAG: 16S rRNA (cytidine(1402)-2'-O)-methyltransferase [Thermocrinis sp.]|jgi:16S rRNA (cytidine1402-2'-O)-methyltransferase|uniref:16S rRNA (cytidine(1402)-2'-O)-methyltransferase n=1 Tax=Thermocrinis sp. TaxID=2024383 RepID=UPI00157EA523|nr:16S rRNA (cytidine(1402)-2'-O)-methyltransferase [Thermocrinis sp.]NAZ24001.1 16S rRNA (cytidine(1402)-2'-O)-methyltransferase [Thermocrinis sp.]